MNDRCRFYRSERAVSHSGTNYHAENPLRKITIAILTFIMPAVMDLSRADAQDAAYRDAMADAVRAAASEVLPSVVTIEIVGVSGRGEGEGEVEQDAPTSGVVVDSSGFIIASSLAASRSAVSILLVLPDGTRQAAEVIARDHHRDLALLKITAPGDLIAIDFPPQLDLRIGRTTVAVGRYGRQGSPLVSSGVLSAIDRLDGIALQTDARVSPAFYGGPLVDLNGNVLGILIPAVAEGGAPDATSWYDSGVAFAVPTNIIQKKLERLKKGEDIKKGKVQDVGGSIRRRLIGPPRFTASSASGTDGLSSRRACDGRLSVHSLRRHLALA